MIGILKSLFRPKPKSGPFAHIKLEHHTIAGTHFRVVQEPLEMPYLRQMAYYIALLDFNRKASTADMLAFCDGMKAALNAKDIAKAGFYAHALEANLILYVSFFPIFDMATTFILLDDEPFEEIPQVFNDKKLALIKNDEIKAFFLSKTLASLQHFNKDLEISQITQYIETQEHKITTETFLDAIETLKGRKSLTDLIKKHSASHKSQG